VAVDAAFDALFRAILEERDVDAFMACWADDHDVQMWGSDLAERADGRDAIRRLGEAIVAGDEIRFEWADRFVYTEGEVAWVNAAGTCNGMPYRLTAVLVRRAGAWRWHTFSGSIPI
jgi:hypothetical protein